MSIHSNVTEQNIFNLRKLAHQHKNQRAFKIKNRILKKTHDIKLAESLPPITKKLDVNNESTKHLVEIVKKSDVEDGNTQTKAIENSTGTQPLRDTLSSMKSINKFFKLEEEDNGDLFWNKILIKQLGDNTFSISDE